MPWDNRVDYDMLVGVAFDAITAGTDGIRFDNNGVTEFIIMHEQDCCESVSLQHTLGNVEDLVGKKITNVEIVPFNGPNLGYDDAFEWTVIKIAVDSGWNSKEVAFMFYGSSNGYYGTGVDLYNLITN